MRYIAAWGLLLTLSYDNCLRAYEASSGVLKYEWENEHRCVRARAHLEGEGRDGLCVMGMLVVVACACLCPVVGVHAAGAASSGRSPCCPKLPEGLLWAWQFSMAIEQMHRVWRGIVCPAPAPGPAPCRPLPPTLQWAAHPVTRPPRCFCCPAAGATSRTWRQTWSSSRWAAGARCACGRGGGDGCARAKRGGRGRGRMDGVGGWRGRAGMEGEL